MTENIFLQISLLLGITVTIAFFARLIRVPLMVAYLIAGIVVGPLFLDLMHGDAGLFHALAEFGVVLLLFLLGLSLNFDHIKKIGKVSLIAGLTQFVFTASIGFFLLTSLGFATNPALYLAVALTFSSTIIIVKLLSDKKDTESVYGRYTLGLMVVQDIIALLIMIVLTSLSGSQNWMTGVWELVLKMLALASAVYLLARFLVPKILNHIASSSEFLFIFTVAWCFGIASIMFLLGFSIEVGALIAGLTLGSSPYQSEISSRIKPLRDFFIILFFLILGSELSLSNLHNILVPGIILSLFILFGDTFILYHTFRFLRFTRRNSFLAGVTASQVSEFGFILLFTGVGLGHVGENELSVFTLVALITIVISSYAFTYNETLYRFFLPLFQLFGKDRYRQKEKTPVVYDVWVFGYHRIGWRVCQMLMDKHISFVVVDFNPEVAEKARRRGFPVVFGDVADVEFLETLPLGKAKLVISTLPEVDDQITLIKHVRKQKSDARIIANLYEPESLPRLYKAGADFVMMPHLLGGSWIAEILGKKTWTKRTFETLRRDQQKEMRQRFQDGADM